MKKVIGILVITAGFLSLLSSCRYIKKGVSNEKSVSSKSTSKVNILPLPRKVLDKVILEVENYKETNNEITFSNDTDDAEPFLIEEDRVWSRTNNGNLVFIDEKGNKTVYLDKIDNLVGISEEYIYYYLDKNIYRCDKNNTKKTEKIIENTWSGALYSDRYKKIYYTANCPELIDHETETPIIINAMDTETLKTTEIFTDDGVENSEGLVFAWGIIGDIVGGEPILCLLYPKASCYPHYRRLTFNSEKLSNDSEKEEYNDNEVYKLKDGNFVVSLGDEYENNILVHYNTATKVQKELERGHEKYKAYGFFEIGDNLYYSSVLSYSCLNLKTFKYEHFQEDWALRQMRTYNNEIYIFDEFSDFNSDNPDQERKFKIKGEKLNSELKIESEVFSVSTDYDNPLTGYPILFTGRYVFLRNEKIFDLKTNTLIDLMA